MLLRSYSSSILDSWIPQAKESSPEPEMIPQIPQIPRTRSKNLSPSSSLISQSSEDSLKISKALSENDLREISAPRRRRSLDMASIALSSSLTVEEDEEQDLGAKDSLNRLFISSGLDESIDYDGKVKDSVLAPLIDGGASGNNGGRKCRGGRSGGRSENGDEEFGSDSKHGNDGVEKYYENMIEANPNNSLLLGNYARFLKDVRGDIVRAEEYCSRAILANPGDGSILSLYADLIWQTHKDASRAQTYFDQAIQAAPDDCFVLASYARFLWDSEEDEDEEEEEDDDVAEHGMNNHHIAATNYFQGASPIAASS